MQTTCLIDHSLEGTIPRFLCRACHPELNVSAATRAKLDAEDRGARPRAVAEGGSPARFVPICCNCSVMALEVPMSILLSADEQIE